MKLIGKTDWENVFEGWREREASDPGWIECATTVKGWPDWESWRRFSASQLGLENREWRIFEFEEPMIEIPGMLVGPHPSWQSRHPDTNRFSFSDMLNIPEEYEFWSKHSKILSMLAKFPSSTQFIGLLREDLGHIVCYEGSHRSTAVALAERNKIQLLFPSSPTIALTTLRSGEDPEKLLAQALALGSAKNPGSHQP